MDYLPTTEAQHSNFSTMSTQELTDSLCKSSSGSLIIYARYVPSKEKNFSQVVIPVAVSYETFLVKLCVALGIQKEDVQRVIHLPDILIKSTEDVIRLQPFDKLEVTLETGVLPKFVRKSFCHLLTGRVVLQCCLAALLLLATATVQQQSNERILALMDSRLSVQKSSTGLPANKELSSLYQRLGEVEKTIKQLSLSLPKTLEALDSDSKNLYTRTRQTNDKLTTLADSVKSLSQLIADEDIEQNAIATNTDEILKELKALKLALNTAKKLKV